MYAINLDGDSRILRITSEKYADTESIMVEKRPEDLVPENATKKEKNARNYLYVDGKYIYDPLPEPEPVEPRPTTEYVSYDEMAEAIKEGVNSYNG